MVTWVLIGIPVIVQDCLPPGTVQLLFETVMRVDNTGNLPLPALTETLMRRSLVLLFFFTDSTDVIFGANGVGNGAAREYEWLLNTEANRARATTPTSGKIF